MKGKKEKGARRKKERKERKERNERKRRNVKRLMARKLNVGDLERAAGDANAALAGARLGKFFEISPGVFRLKFNSQQRGEVNVLVDLSFGAFLASRVPASPDVPTQFVAAARSKIDNAILNGVSLVNGDRVLRFDFEKKERFALVFEFIGKGNALVLDDAGKIVFVWKPAVYSSRKLALRETYVAPPAGGKTPAPADKAARLSSDIEEEYWAGENAKPVEKKVNAALRGLEKSLEAQRASLPALEEEEKAALAAGNWIKENRETAEALIAAAKTGNESELKKLKARKEGAFVEFEV